MTDIPPPQILGYDLHCVVRDGLACEWWWSNGDPIGREGLEAYREHYAKVHAKQQEAE